MFKKRNLRRLIDSFGTAFSSERVADLQSYVNHGEYGLAIEILSEMIYEDDIAVDAEQEKAILKSSTDFGVDHDYHAFIGRRPPYPDLRTPEQIADARK